MPGTSNAANSGPTQNAEAKELSLVGKVELRIALADSDSKLESLLQTYLPPLLLKLASDHSSVRNKVSLANHRAVMMKEQDLLRLLSSHDESRAVPRSFLAADNIFFWIGYCRMSAHQYENPVTVCIFP